MNQNKGLEQALFGLCIKEMGLVEVEAQINAGTSPAAPELSQQAH
ncbi:hypothetical protein ACVRXQ_01300 [Streptococcus panodentis]